MRLSSLHWSCLKKNVDIELAWALSCPFTAISVPCIHMYTPTGDVWRGLGNKCHKYLLLKPICFEKRGGIQLSPVALSPCLLLTCWERLEKRSSSVAWNGAQGDNSQICQNSNSFWRRNPGKEVANRAKLQSWISWKVWWPPSKGQCESPYQLIAAGYLGEHTFLRGVAVSEARAAESVFLETTLYHFIAGEYWMQLSFSH